MNARAHHGFTLIEALVSMAIFSVLALALATFVVDSQKVNFQLQAETDVSTMGQSALDEIRWRLEQSRMILDADSGYLDLVDLAAAPPVEGKLQLPRVEANGAFSPRASGGKDGTFDPTSVGNALFFVEALPPIREPQTGRLVDCFRFVLYYVAEGPRHEKFGPLPDYVDLMRFESVPYADFAQLDSMPEDVRTQVIHLLESKGVTWAWEANAPANGAFSKLAGGAIVIPPEPHHRIEPAKVESAVPGLGIVNAPAGRMAYSIATNTPGDLPIHTQVPKFAVPSNGFPNGFEVQIVGPSHGRKVLARIVLVAETHERFYSRESQMIAAVWD